MSLSLALYEITLLDRETAISELSILKENIKPREFNAAIKNLYKQHQSIILDLNASEVNRRKLTKWQGFNLGDKVTVKSIPAKSMILGIPKPLELATYPSLIGIELTIVEFLDPFIHCIKRSGCDAPGLLAEDIRLI